VLYLLHRYEEAVDDCERVLALNPHHFGAASGMGLCLWSLKRTAAALAAFERALEIHPGLTVIRRHTETLRDELDAAGPPAPA
jgi:tetratricopeptide (TPR) repeat protein